MFSFGHSGGTATSIDPEEVRDCPPPATVVYFPQNDIEIQASDDWVQHPPNLFEKYATVTKPSDVRKSHVEALNVSIQNGVPLEDFIPDGRSESSHLPPREWITKLDPSLRRPSVPVYHKTPERHLLLSNGHKAPNQGDFAKYAQELACATDDGLLAIGRRKSKKGHTLPHLNHYRDFWAKLEPIAQHWDESLDDYHYPDKSSTPPSPTSPRALRRVSLFMTEKEPHQSHNHESKSTKKYKGWRKSTGSKMPDRHRTDVVKALIKPIVYSFHCQIFEPRKTPQLEISKLLIPVTQSAVVWRVPENKDLMKRGVMEGPLLALQCRHETSFAKSPELAPLDLAREAACLLLLAQERAREGKPKRIPGANKWYTSKPRWGGGPGGEFGEAEGNTDEHPMTKRLTYVPGSLPRRMTEEEIWKELKPNSGIWQPRTNYIAIGKERASRVDSVFMVSSLFHHIALVRMDVDPAYLDLITFGEKPRLSIPNESWYKPAVYRTKWYDLLDRDDRLEVFRGLWALASYLMRVDALQRPTSSRQHSEAPTAVFGRKSSLAPKSSLTPQRSHSVAF